MRFLTYPHGTFNIMRLNAYVLAADPAWIQVSVLSYYEIVDTLVVSYDKRGIGWSGVPIPVDECVALLRAIDKDRKIKFISGDFSARNRSPMDSDTYQRRCALEESSANCDWVLMVDADEVLPDARKFQQRLSKQVPYAYGSVEWPMRPLFQRLPDGSFLEVCSLSGRQYSEYPGPIAIRPGVELTEARRNQALQWRFGLRPGLKARIKNPLKRLIGRQPTVHVRVCEDEAIWHFTWIRTEEQLRRKLSSWSHSLDFDTETYLDNVWRSAPENWRKMQNFHPIYPELWPALRTVNLPITLNPVSA
ncbi:MAG: hypothetical protein JO170_27730 [Verrucomicrobia bacterium]|nr:hypothetical protein [Verrucomicrobiota bacterium]